MNVIRNILNSRSEKNGSFFMAIQNIVGFKPRTIGHYKKAFTHRSMNMKDKKGNAVNYERLEFLGDAMLSSVIAAHLFTEVPEGNEGYLTKMRSKIVSRINLVLIFMAIYLKHLLVQFIWTGGILIVRSLSKKQWLVLM